MSWAENRRRLLIAVVAFALIVAVITIAGLASSNANTSSEAGAPPGAGNAEPTGALRIIKAGIWPSDGFIFTWDCDNGVSGQANFSGDFTGANYTVSPELPLGTVCTVEETDGSLKVSDYLVTTHTEAQAGFQAINPRDVSIDNSTGFNTIQFKNDLLEPEAGPVWLEKRVIGGPEGATFSAGVTCGDQSVSSDNLLKEGELHLEGVLVGTACLVTEDLGESPQWVLTATHNGVSQTILNEGGLFGFFFDSTGNDAIVLTNCYVADPYFNECRPVLDQQ